MRRFTAVLAGLLGLSLVPMALSVGTSWLALGAHFALGSMVAWLAMVDGFAGRPGAARSWGGFHVVVTLGMVAAMQAGSWDRGGWVGWWLYVPLVAWGWIPVLLALVAGRVGDVRQRQRARRAVRIRHRTLAKALAEALPEDGEAGAY